MSKLNASRREILAGAGKVAVAGATSTAALLLPAAAALGTGRHTPIQKLWREYVALLPEVERPSGEHDLARDRQIAATPACPRRVGPERQ